MLNSVSLLMIFSNQEQVAIFESRFGSHFPLEFNAFDFFIDDPGSDKDEHPGVRFVHQVQRDEMDILKKAEMKYQYHKPKNIQGFDIGEPTNLRNLNL